MKARRLFGGLAVVGMLSTCAVAVEVSPGHPRVLITKEDVPRLVKLCSPGGDMHERYRIILDRANEFVDGKAKFNPGAIWGPARDWCYLAFAALIEDAAGRDGRKYAEPFLEHIWERFIKSAKDWEEKNKKPCPGNLRLPAGHYGYHSLVYDWMYPVLTREERKKYADLVASTLCKGGAQKGLSPHVSWWYNQEWGVHHLSDVHNRTAIVCKTLTALATAGEGTRYEEKIQQFLESFQKLIPESCIPALNQMGGAWGEGLGHFYYMNPVQFYVFEAWRTATGQDLWREFKPDGFAREISKWHLYSTRPFNLRHAYIDDSGGSFPRLLVAPLLAKVYRDGVAQWAFEHFDGKGRKIAGRGFGFWEAWQGIVWHDPTVPVVDFRKMPTAYLFKGAGHVYMRSGWEGPDETWAFFGAGPRYAGWAAHDEGHFLIAKRGPLVTRGSGKAEYFGYTHGTAIFNCVLVYDPNERFGRHEKINENDGGLRRDFPSRQIERGHIVAFRHRPEAFTYAAADLTRGYANSKDSDRMFKLTNSRKMRSITRQFLYLRGEKEHFVIFDRVDAASKEFPKTWMLHMGAEPQLAAGGIAAKPADSGGGFVTYAHGATTFSFLSCPEGEKDVISKGKTKMFCRTLLPKRARITKRGGKGFDTWGNPHNPKARRQHLSARQKKETPPYYRWRLEVEPTEKSEYDVFLHVLSLAGEDETVPPAVRLVEKDDRCGAKIDTGDSTIEVLFNRSGDVGGEISRKKAGGPVERWPLPNTVAPTAAAKEATDE